MLFAGDRELVITASRPHQGRMLVHFEGVDDRTAAEALQGVELTAAPLGDDVELDDDELWVHEVVGAEVHDRAGARGRTGRRRSRPTRRTTCSCSTAARWCRWCSWSSSATASS